MNDETTDVADEQRPLISLLLVPSEPDPEDPNTVYERTLKNGQPFILLFPALTPEDRAVIVVEAAGTPAREVATLLRDVGLALTNALDSPEADGE